MGAAAPNTLPRARAALPGRRAPTEALQAPWRSEAAQLADELRRTLRASEVRAVPQDLTAAIARLHWLASVDELLAHAPAALCHAAGFSRAMISRVQQSTWTPHTTYPPTGHEAGRFAEFCGTPIGFRSQGVEAEIARRRTTLLITGSDGDRRASRAFLSDTRCETYLAAPIIVEARLVGVLHVDRLSQPRPVDRGDRDLVDRFAAALADLWHRLLLIRKIACQAEQFQRAVDAIIRFSDDDLVAGCGASASGPAEAPPRPPSGESLAERVLTERELQVLAQVAGGATNAEIGRRLGISTGTVKSHVKKIHRRLRVQNRSQAAAWYVQHHRPSAHAAQSESVDGA